MRVTHIREEGQVLVFALTDGRSFTLSDPAGQTWANRSYYLGKEVALNADGSLAFFRN